MHQASKCRNASGQLKKEKKRKEPQVVTKHTSTVDSSNVQIIAASILAAALV